MPKSLLSTFTCFMSFNPCNNAINKIEICIPILPLRKTFGNHVKKPKFKLKLSNPVPLLFSPSALLLLEIQLIKCRTRVLCHCYQGSLRECLLLALTYQHPYLLPCAHASSTPRLQWTACFKCPVRHFCAITQ